MNKNRIDQLRAKDVQRAKLVPVDVFEKPADVVRSDAVDTKDKQKILNQWEVDAQALSRANDEGMTGGEPTDLAKVQEARRKVFPKNISPAEDRRTSGKPAR
jgi:hypothetical protein